MSTILAVLTDAATAGAALDAAQRAAKADAGSRLVALHVRLDPESLILPTEEVMTPRRRKALETLVGDRARAVRAAFDAWRQRTGAPATWNEVAGTVATEVVHHGKAADLIVLAHPLEHEGQDALHAVLFETGRLLLYVPPAGAAGFGEHVGIAWKDCDQAKAAVAAALPWLKSARHVSVLAVGADGPPGPSQELLELLRSNGIAAETVLAHARHESIGAQLLDEAQAIGADCLVMGAYRHGELKERLLGGATRHVLESADIPLFLHH